MSRHRSAGSAGPAKGRGNQTHMSALNRLAQNEFRLTAGATSP
jgi:hypothetical protein